MRQSKRALIVFGSLEGKKTVSNAAEKKQIRNTSVTWIYYWNSAVVVHPAHLFSLMGCRAAGWLSQAAPALHTGRDTAANTC